MAKRTGPSQKEQLPYDGKMRAFILKDTLQDQQRVVGSEIPLKRERSATAGRSR